MEGEQVKKGKAIFPRMDVEAELVELEAMACPEKEYPPVKELIDYEDFEKLDMRVGLVESCKKHPKADKLLVFQIKMGNEVRQILSGVADCYKPEDMLGKKVIVVANLKPRKLRGLESNGMLLFADNENRYEYLTVDAPDGEIVS
jgi:methionyl-tRNA synthetase